MSFVSCESQTPFYFLADSSELIEGAADMAVVVSTHTFTSA